MEQHPTRQALIKAAQSGDSRIDKHIADCNDCRQLFELFRAFPVTGELELPDAPAGWIAKAREIANSGAVAGWLKGMAAKLSFDSWTLPATVGVRSQNIEHDRRLQYEIGALLLDIRAEKQAAAWDFTARLSGEQADAKQFMLKIDRRLLAPDSLGFYHWSSPKPPKQIQLTDGDVVLDLPELTWTQKPH